MSFLMTDCAQLQIRARHFLLSRSFPQQALVLTAPCDSDTRTWIATIDENIGAWRKVVDGDPTKPGDFGLRAMVNMGDASKRDRLERALSMITESETRKGRIGSFNRDAGFVTASSGTRKVSVNGRSWPLDWALISLYTQRPMTNTIVDVPHNSLMTWYEGIEINEWSASNSLMGLQVSKKGRTTGWTDGTVNAIKTDLRLTTEEQHPKVNVYGKPISAWAIPTSSKATTAFASRGDSGSFIVEISGKIIGLLFGASYDGTAYFIPFNVVVADIEKVTRAKIINPSKD
ncbi:hypothetical protein VTN96DRAFT_343 [Rasamsonia emersonii]|uniref:Peptidase S7 domain-containing protein n=1 Tax=Rasamsonia emersonii (strain ATCC 16479 / CBS 393.64 / IMI 116815) TaxID=1408163 RepID=A0A0F4YI15_RASE3|nr:hypothetical protein T310_8197 [Rasamsonia emersonii CBS 393.64]KKA17859.1 hypothetical protein T310_8197 [Rasamsonia emersonii CBS 393.64]